MASAFGLFLVSDFVVVGHDVVPNKLDRPFNSNSKVKETTLYYEKQPHNGSSPRVKNIKGRSNAKTMIITQVTQ